MVERTRIDKPVFSISLAVLVSICVSLAADPKGGASTLKLVLHFITSEFGWLFLWFTAGVFGLLIWLAVSRYGLSVSLSS